MDNKNLIFLDTETTGLNSKTDSIIEIACVRVSNLNLLDLSSLGFDAQNIFHTHLKTNIRIHDAAFRVHGISNAFLKNKPEFKNVYTDLLKFIGDCPIVAHNAKFDINFLNEALGGVGSDPIKNEVIDSLTLARKLYPGSPVGLDALIRRFGLSNRGLHSALEDAMILSKVYAAMHAPKQGSLFVDKIKIVENNYKMCSKLISI